MSVEQRCFNRRFNLMRNIDRSGISGTGIVAEGVEFSDGQVVLCWLRATEGGKGSIATYRSMGQCVIIHGHNGDTKVEWVDD